MAQVGKLRKVNPEEGNNLRKILINHDRNYQLLKTEIEIIQVYKYEGSKKGPKLDEG